jgi:hypothetical protein
MTTWNYRVFREATGDLAIRSVFYDANGQILSCSRDVIVVNAESIDGLIQLIDDMKAALRLPILSLADVPDERETQPIGQQITLSHAELLAELELSHPKRRTRATKRKAS